MGHSEGGRSPALRLPAGELDAAVRTAFAALLLNARQLIGIASHLAPHDQQVLVEASARLASRPDAMSIASVRDLLLDVGLQLMLSSPGASAAISTARLLDCLGLRAEHDQTYTLPITFTSNCRGHEPRLRLEPPVGRASGDPALMQVIARGFAARDELLAMTDEDMVPTSSTRVRHLVRYVRLAYLAPDIIRSIMAGHQPRHLTARYLVRCRSLPLGWVEQRRMLGFPAI